MSFVFIRDDSLVFSSVSLTGKDDDQSKFYILTHLLKDIAQEFSLCVLLHHSFLNNSSWGFFHQHADMIFSFL